MPERVGFIGVGRMGSGIASNALAAGEEVVVYDIDDVRVAEMEAAGAEAADSIEEVVTAVDVVFTSLPSDEIVETVYRADDGILEGVTDGMLLIELSTISPGVMEGIAEEIADRGVAVDLVDAPVFGSPETAAAGELTIVVGADASAFERARPYLAPSAETIFHVGDVGRGKTIKLIRNAINYGNWAIASELFALAERHDINQEELFEITSSGGPLSSILGSRFPRVAEGAFEPGFTLEGAAIDLDYALGLADDLEDELPVTAAVLDRYQYAIEAEAADRDYAILMRALSD